MFYQLCRNSRCGFWAPNDTKHLFAGATDHNPVPINRWPNDLKFWRNRLRHKGRMPCRRTIILRNGRLSASAAFRTNQGNSSLVGHLRSIGWRLATTLPEFCSRCSKYVLGSASLAKRDHVQDADRRFDACRIPDPIAQGYIFGGAVAVSRVRSRTAAATAFYNCP
jgi:hypothetical protein